MELKRMINTSPGILPSTDCLPTCRVCNGPGNGLHYGVNTCDACKGFYHRTIKLHLHYTCKDDSTCRIEYGRGKMCQHCRYQKCISVGMSKHAIKTGRYTLSRKADCILEMKKREMRTKCSNKQTPASDDQSTCSPDVLWIEDRTNTPSHEDDLRNTASLDDSSMTQSPSQLAASLTPVPSTDSENSPYLTASVSSDFDSDTTSSSDSNVLMQSVLHDLLHTQSKAISPEVMSSTNITTASSLLTLIKQDARTSEIGSSPENSTNSHTINKDSCHDAPSISLSVEEDYNHPISNLYTHKDVVIKRLLVPRLTSVNACKWTPEELAKQSIEYYEVYRMKEKMFGRLQTLSEEEYDGVMEQTGIDADGRKSFLSQFLDGMESLLCTMVHFMKVIPGFLSLDLDDQIALVKYNRLEFNLITNYPFSNVKLGVVHCQNNKWLCIQEAASSELYWCGREYLDIQGEFQKLDLNEEEQTILCAVSAMTPDRNELTNKSSVHEIYRNLTDVLIYCLRKRHKSPHQVFGSIMQLLTRFKQLEGNFKDVIGKLNLPKYSQLNKRPLLKEMVTDFYVSTSGT